MRLEEEFKTFSTASFSRDQMSDKGEFCCVHYGDIHTLYGNVVDATIDEMPRISIAQASRYKNLKDGDILLADASEDDEGIGKPVAIVCHNQKVIAGLHTIPLRKKDEKKWHATFPSYLFSGRMVKEQVERLSEGTKVNSITYTKIKDVLIPLPPKPEQERIADALTAIDSLIANLERTIQKKKHIREGAMEELLSGKRRLPGFSGEWVEKEVGTICPKMRRGEMLKASDYKAGSVPVIAAGIEPAGYHNMPNRPQNTITISSSGANAGYIQFHPYPIFAGDCFTIESSDVYDIQFIFYALKCKQREVFKLQTGGAQPHVHPKDIAPYIIPYPSDIREQHAIADTLTAMDDEIALLQAEKTKYQQIRSGMMDDLLTGKIRLR